MCPGCLLAGTAWGVMWCASKILTYRAQRRIERDMAAVEVEDERAPSSASSASAGAPQLLDAPLAPARAS
ncbi:MAG: hypothetical protein IPM79_25795 [Polyangiaceae bacterium]|nr:hypothetical protein [Polyangiaceae bacterium]